MLLPTIIIKVQLRESKYCDKEILSKNMENVLVCLDVKNQRATDIHQYFRLLNIINEEF